MEVSGNFMPWPFPSQRKEPPLPTEYKSEWAQRKQFLVPSRNWTPACTSHGPHDFTTHTLPTTGSHIIVKLCTRAFQLKPHTWTVPDRSHEKQLLYTQTGFPLTCKPMDPCASNFLNCCWNNSLHICPALIYGPSALSIQGSDITINAQLYHRTIWTLLVLYYLFWWGYYRYHWLWGYWVAWIRWESLVGARWIGVWSCRETWVHRGIGWVRIWIRCRGLVRWNRWVRRIWRCTWSCGCARHWHVSCNKWRTITVLYIHTK